ncbi:MAG TPA: hypothetical protein VNV44_11725 [Solirubrobacteraceae bacterium]|jgi:hypothetical protein|nr:hypothetical protein [Solirubrobacteraceae bacterium]
MPAAVNFSQIRSRSALRGAVFVARAEGPDWREACERTAGELHMLDALPDAWDPVTRVAPGTADDVKQLMAEAGDGPAGWTSAVITLAEAGEARTAHTSKPAPPTPSAKLLEEPAAVMLGPDRQVELDRVVTVAARQLGRDYLDVLQELQDAAVADRQMLKGEPVGPGEWKSERTTLGGLLGQVGVKQLDAVEQDSRLLAERDTAAQRTLDAGLAPVRDLDVDGQGHVLLDKDADVVTLLRDENTRERRWRRARELDAHNYGDRETFDREDMMLLEAGLDLVATLERPATVRAAHEAAAATARELDQVIDANAAKRSRLFTLDSAISTLEAERELADNGTPATSRPRRDRPPAFVELTAPEMLKALEAYKAADKTVTLDQAAAQVAGFELDDAAPLAAIPTIGPRYDGPGGISYPESDLDARIKQHVQEHGCDNYLCGLNAITGGTIPGPDGSTPGPTTARTPYGNPAW